MRFRSWLGLAAIALVGAGVIVACLAAGDVRARTARLAAERQISPTRNGPIEYATWGQGPPVLVIHGAGGGFDQGRLIAEACGGEGFRWIAPSRFGYLGSPLPPDASTAAQADAFADLLDHLGIERVDVLAFSGGAPPALQFAERHPERVRRIALLSSAPFTPYAPDTQARALPDWLYQALFGNDAIYWTLSRLAPAALGRAFDARPELRAGLSADEHAFVSRLVDAFMPASHRLDGVRNEGAAIDPRAAYALEGIAAPALVVHARDDRLNDFAISEALCHRLPNADFVSFERGGHLLLGHHAEVRERVSAFLEDESATASC